LARRGCQVPAFPSIFAAGENALCLHYMNPTGRVGSGDLIQIDVGGRVAGLCADISRVFPADGLFTGQQKELYAAVRACQEKAFQIIKPGSYISAINDEVKNTAKQQLEIMGVISHNMPEQSDVSSYYWHRVSHHMGLDVHDVNIPEIPLESGMVLTVEPGIYLPHLGIGFRIEDDVLVTANGCEVLSSFVPREWDEICAMVGTRGGE
jgi:Xaa-Pro aminopeptidase